jgi:hypothetical protein
MAFDKKPVSKKETGPARQASGFGAFEGNFAANPGGLGAKAEK